MFRTIAFALAIPILLACSWVLLGFQPTTIVLVVIGFLGSAYFVLGWFSHMMYGKLRGNPFPGFWDTFDFVGLQLFAFTLLTLTVSRAIFNGGVQPPDDTGSALTRIGLILFLDVVVLMRAVRWHKLVRSFKRGEPTWRGKPVDSP